MVGVSLLSDAHGEGAREYRVGPGDVLRVHVYNESELSGRVVVNDNCTVTLSLVGRLSVCGSTPYEVEVAVTQAYAEGFLVHPTVAVSVEEFRSQKVDVLGSVNETGPVFLRGRTSVLEVISEAGGPSHENVLNVEVVRRGGQRESYSLMDLVDNPNAVEVRAGDKVILQPGEVVYVEGEVKKPGVVLVSDGLTVTRALALAGGSLEYGNLRRVLIRRADGGQERVNVHRIQRGRAPDVPVGPQDQIMVPAGPF